MANIGYARCSTVAQAALFNVSRPTVYRSLERTTGLPMLPADTRPAPGIAKYDQLLTWTADRHAGRP